MTDKCELIRDYLQQSAWLQGEVSCRFLAAGEYNENYMVSDGLRTLVFRINHGTQLNLDKQMEYEFRALEAVSPSAVTPRPLYYALDVPQLGNGVLLMEYIAGRPLDYRCDLPAAAGVFARIHAVPTSDALIVQADPARDIAAESYGLLQRYPGPHYPSVRALLLDYHDKIVDSAAEMAALYENEPFCIVNTEVNSGNFIIGEQGAYLVDWEKAVVSYRYQDLAHFTIPTTTLWKTDFRFSEKHKREFLSMYLRASESSLETEEVYEKNMMMERVILLRALSWCYMAYHEYTSAGRKLAHSDTFATITSYLDEAECFLQ